MRVSATIVAAAMLVGAFQVAAPAKADVVMQLPPEPIVFLSPRQRALRVQAARLAVVQISDFSSKRRPDFLNEAFRTASAKNITNVNGVREAAVIGERVYVVATVTRSVSALAEQKSDAYFQCLFDDKGHVVKVEILQ